MTLFRPAPLPTTTRAQRGTLWPRLDADPAHGPLPALLLGLTALTGIVDAVSILALGRVFVANMTGNVVFAAFAVVGAAGFALTASLAALAGFVAGAAVGGWLIRRFGHDRARLLASGSVLELILVAAALGLTAASGSVLSPASRDIVAVMLAVGAGMQNAVVRRLAVPDLTTTVLTMTLTAIAADLRAGKPGPAFNRRVFAVATMLAGAGGGAELVLHLGPVAALALATAVLAVIAVAAARTTRAPGAWRSPTQPGAAPRPTLAEPTLAESTLAESTLAEPTLAESTLAESTLAESTLAESTLAESTLAEPSFAEPSFAEPSFAGQFSDGRAHRTHHHRSEEGQP